MLQHHRWQATGRALFDSDLVATRIMLAIAELCWAIMLLWPGDSFARPTYTVMSGVAGEDLWAAIFLVSGFTQGAIVVSTEFDSRFARYFACWNALLWLFTVVSMLISVYPPPAAIGGEIALAVAAMWIFVRPFILSAGYRRAFRELI